MPKYLIKRMNKKITKDTMDEYTNNPLQLNTVSGSVKKMVIMRIKEKKPEIKIVRSFSAD